MFSKQDYGRLRKYNTFMLVTECVALCFSDVSDKQQRLFLEFRKFLNQMI